MATGRQGANLAQLAGASEAAQGLIASARSSAVAPFLAMDVFKEAARLSASGRSIMRMEAGEPGAPAPLVVREAAMRALQDGRIGYTQTLGIPALREAIAAHYQDTYGVGVDAGRIAVTTGSSGGFVLAFLALFDVGARVAIASPGYPAYRNILEALGVEVVALTTRAADRHIVTAQMIESAHAQKPLDGVLLMSPANPTGTMMRDQDLRAVCAVCERLGVRFISDEIYHGLTYAWPAQTALAFSQQAVVVNSFSKYYCMTGWRIGWLVLPEPIVRPVERLAQSLAISAPTLSQIAACEAFAARDELELVKAGYERSRSLLLERLPLIGLGEFHPVDGAFYVYLDVSRYTNDSMAFGRQLLDEAGVATTPGPDFDREQGARSLRLSFAGTSGDVEEALDRIGRWLAKR